MMLDAYLLNVRHLERQLGAQILRMQIISHGGGRDAEELLHSFQRFAVKDQRLVVFQVADMLAQKDVMVLGEAECALEFSAASQNFGDRKVERHRMGRVAPRAAQD